MWFFAAITRRLDDILKLMRLMQGDLDRIEKTLQRWSLPQPEAMTVHLLREENAMLVYEAHFPAPPSPIGDIVRQKFTATADGETVADFEYAMDVTKSDEFSVADDAEVVLTIAYIDDSSNVGVPHTQTFTALDTIPPEAPGPFQEITLVREEP